MRFTRLLMLFLTMTVSLFAKLPDLTEKDVISQMKEIFKGHAQHKELNRELMKRALNNYLEELDPTKTYLIESDIDTWANPTDATLDKGISDYKEGKFTLFDEITDKMISVIPRRHIIEKDIDKEPLPAHVNVEEFKDLKWAASIDELKDRLKKIKSLQQQSAAKLPEDAREKAAQRIEKRQAKFEEELLTPDPELKNRFILTHTLKSLASSLDTHTSYFTPDEAAQFMINVQQRLFGIGAQLRDDINGFTVVKVIEGGPAAATKELKAKDRIIAVNGEPVVGMDITDAVDLIRGEENTPVTLTVIRDVADDDGKKHEEKLDITLKRGSVVLKETRFETKHEPFGEGVILYLKLFSFYQDADSSSAEDLNSEIERVRKDHLIKGIILDLRNNSGGMLTQAVAVSGLFITKGVVVSIKDDSGHVQHLRDLDGKTSWNGPLIILINRASASAAEIVAQTLQDYGRALVVGDDHSFGKGSFQTFTLGSSKNSDINPKGEFKVTRGRYYTVSGKTPQLVGVQSDIIIPGVFSESEIGEKFAKYPLENDRIKPNFDDDLSDVPFLQRDKIRLLYKFDLQKPLTTYQPYIEQLKENTAQRLKENINYQNFMKEVKKKGDEIDPENVENFGQNDLQLQEAYNVMKDLILLHRD
jgi:carboxyl-terminal processing protease